MWAAVQPATRGTSLRARRGAGGALGLVHEQWAAAGGGHALEGPAAEAHAPEAQRSPGPSQVQVQGGELHAPGGTLT